MAITTDLFEYQFKELPDGLKDNSALKEFKKFLNEVWAKYKDYKPKYWREKLYEVETDEDIIKRQPFLFFEENKVKSRNYVGYIKFKDYEFNLYPKICRPEYNDKGELKNKEEINNMLLLWLQYSNNTILPKVETSLDEINNFDFMEILIYLFAKYTSDLLSTSVYQHYEEINEETTFLKGKNLTTPLLDEFPEEPTISNHIDFRVNAQRRADCCEVIDTEVFKEFLFPEFPGERFLGEGPLWNGAGFKYDTVYIKEILYVCEYLEGGLTESGRKLRLMCPHGGMANCNSFYDDNSSRKVSDKIRRKEAMLFVCYGCQAKLNRAQIIDRANDKEFVKRYYLAGKLLHAYWKHKYLR